MAPECTLVAPECTLVPPKYILLTPEGTLVTPECTLVEPERDLVAPEYVLVAPECILESAGLVDRARLPPRLPDWPLCLVVASVRRPVARLAAPDCRPVAFHYQSGRG